VLIGMLTGGVAWSWARPPAAARRDHRRAVRERHRGDSARIHEM